MDYFFAISTENVWIGCIAIIAVAEIVVGFHLSILYKKTQYKNRKNKKEVPKNTDYRIQNTENYANSPKQATCLETEKTRLTHLPTSDQNTPSHKGQVFLPDSVMSKSNEIDGLLETMQFDYENRLGFIERITSDIAHTIKTPLAGIYAIVLLLKEKTSNNNVVFDYLGLIEKSLNQIEENIQAYRRLTIENTASHTVSSISFRDRLYARLKCAVLSSEKQLYIDCNNIEELTIDSETTKLFFLAVDCIIENATFYANANSIIHVRGYTVDDHYSLQIENEGQIIDDAIASLIFENGFSTHSSSGKGLYIAQRVVKERLRGEIRFENILTPKMGVRFFIDINLKSC